MHRFTQPIEWPSDSLNDPLNGLWNPIELAPGAMPWATYTDSCRWPAGKGEVNALLNCLLKTYVIQDLNLSGGDSWGDF